MERWSGGAMECWSLTESHPRRGLEMFSGRSKPLSRDRMIVARQFIAWNSRNIGSVPQGRHDSIGPNLPTTAREAHGGVLVS
jgi:hypothetical protein